MDNLDITALYFRDADQYAHLINLPKDQERDLVEHARRGNAEARELIILACLAYVIRVASTYFRTRSIYHDEFLDLVSVGHLELVESLDLALTKQSCFPYLCACARFAIHRYCYEHSDLITRKQGTAQRETMSLQALQSEGFDLSAPEAVQTDESQVRYGPLYEAIATLNEKQQEVLIRHYGLFGLPEERLADLTASLKIPHAHHQKAINHLRKRLK